MIDRSTAHTEALVKIESLKIELGRVSRERDAFKIRAERLHYELQDELLTTRTLEGRIERMKDEIGRYREALQDIAADGGVERSGTSCSLQAAHALDRSAHCAANDDPEGAPDA